MVLELLDLTSRVPSDHPRRMSGLGSEEEAGVRQVEGGSEQAKELESDDTVVDDVQEHGIG